jgi:hypothetical protein
VEEEEDEQQEVVADLLLFLDSFAVLVLARV